MDRGLKQEELAGMWGISTAGLAQWESGVSPPREKYYPKIIEFLGYVPFELEDDSLAAKSKYYRFANGLRQKDLAKLINVDPSTICRIETREMRFLNPAKSKIMKFFQNAK